MKREKISVLIPAFNEEENILLTVKETIAVFDDLGEDYEVIIVDDGSYDATYNVIEKELVQLSSRVKIERYIPNRGKGFAIKYGFNFVTGDYVLFLDADLDLHPSQIVNFLQLMKREKADIVMGSKMHKNSIVDYPFTRRFCCMGYYLLVKLLFGLPVRDTQTGFKLFKYKALEMAIKKIVVKKYAFDLELLVVLNKYGYKIVEGPIYLRQARKYNRVRLKDILNILWDTMAIFYRLYIKRYYD